MESYKPAPDASSDLPPPPDASLGESEALSSLSLRLEMLAVEVHGASDEALRQRRESTVLSSRQHVEAMLPLPPKTPEIGGSEDGPRVVFEVGLDPTQDPTLMCRREPVLELSPTPKRGRYLLFAFGLVLVGVILLLPLLMFPRARFRLSASRSAEIWQERAAFVNVLVLASLVPAEAAGASPVLFTPSKPESPPTTRLSTQVRLPGSGPVSEQRSNQQGRDKQPIEPAMGEEPVGKGPVY